MHDICRCAKNWATSLAVAELDLRADAGGRWRVEGKRGRIVRPDPGRADPRLKIDELRLIADDARGGSDASR